jgi:Uri superfamily endonuclease
MGPGGFKRVTRHLNVSAGRNNVRKWHIDYLSSVAEIVAIGKIEARDQVECEIAQRLAFYKGLTGIVDFGSSDCRCRTHLFYTRHLHDLERAIQRLLDDKRKEMNCMVSVETLYGFAEEAEAISAHNLVRAANRGRARRTQK